MIPSPSALLDSLSLRPQGATVDELHGFLLRAGIAVEKIDLVRSLDSLHRDGRVSLGLDRRNRGARKWHDGTRVGRVRTAERDKSVRYPGFLTTTRSTSTMTMPPENARPRQSSDAGSNAARTWFIKLGIPACHESPAPGGFQT